MKKFVHIIIVCIISVACINKNKRVKSNDEIFSDTVIPIDSEHSLDTGYIYNGELYFSYAEEMPQYKNGWSDLRKYIIDNITYPQSAIDDSTEGKVYLQFVINEDGSISNIEVVRGLRFDLDEECIRLIENMPNWKPGKQRGKFVKVMYTIPFVFRLDSNLESEKGNIITPKKDKKDVINFKVFPNPATDKINIEIIGLKEDVKFQLINSKGQILKSGHIFNNYENVSISDLESGIYFIRLVSQKDGLIETKKLIKK